MYTSSITIPAMAHSAKAPRAIPRTKAIDTVFSLRRRTAYSNVAPLADEPFRQARPGDISVTFACASDVTP